MENREKEHHKKCDDVAIADISADISNAEIRNLKANLRRLERIIKGPYARPADYFLRDRLARRLSALKTKAA